MRAATTLVPLLQASGALAMPHVWRGDQLLHADPAGSCAASGFEALDAELPGGGWPQGQLIELLLDQPGIGELSLLMPALSAVARDGRSCVWVLPCERDGRTDAPAIPLPYAPALADGGVDPARCIFVCPATPRESIWAWEQSLRAAHLGALIGWLPATAGSDADFRTLRRLHLLAHRHRALVFVLRASAYAQSPSPATLRLQLAHDGDRLQVTVLKRRGRPLIDPIALQVHPARWNRHTADTAANHAPAPATPSVAARAAALPARTPSLLASLAGPAASHVSTMPRWSMMRAIFSH